MTTAEDHETAPARAGGSMPDPALARTASEFVAYLRLLKVWAGDPSFMELRRRCGVPTSTLADAVRPGRSGIPRLETVRAFVLACGARSDLSRWERAWRLVRSRQLPVPELSAALPPGTSSPPPAADRPAATPSAMVAERQGYSRTRAPAAPPFVPPRQLPRPAEPFVGRGEALAQLDRPPELAHWAPVVLIVGAAGVGKSALALRWAHQRADSYPEGQLYVDLSGTAGGPGSAHRALPALLAALGVAEPDVPAGSAARVGLYRSLTRARRLLVMLDGVSDAGQVRALLPAGPACLVVVTSRSRLSGLVASDGARRLVLAPLPPEDARRLVRSLLGDGRAAREPAATGQLCRLCGYLPLALRIAATRLADSPQWPIAGFVARLAINPLAALEVPGEESLSMRVSLGRSTRRLPGPALYLLRRLARAGGSRFSSREAAALVVQPVSVARQLLETLAAGHLVEPAGRDRYAIPELIRRYAQTLPEPAAQVGPPQPAAALTASAN